MCVNRLYNYIACLLGLLMMLTGCARPKDFLFLEDIQPNITINLQDERPIKLQSGDKLNILVHSRDRELVDMFNVGGSSGSSAGAAGSGQQSTYTVDENGKIEMPIIGSIHVKGLSRLEVQNIIRYKLLASKLVRDPIVMVNFIDMSFYSLGESGSSRHTIHSDKITILEAMSEMGGIPLSGRFDNVLVLRRVDGQQTPYEVNLTKTDEVFGSPVYYLQQNDIVYVKPTDMTLDRTSIYGSSYRNPTFWLSSFNVVLGLILMFTKI